jgi:hypothetical protein
MKLKTDSPKIISVFIALMILSIYAGVQSETATLPVGRFSLANPGSSLPDGWQPLTFKKISRHTRYSVVRDSGRIAVKAVSEQSASGLTKNVAIDAGEYPIIDWEWKVSNVLSKGDASKKRVMTTRPAFMWHLSMTAAGWAFPGGPNMRCIGR